VTRTSCTFCGKPHSERDPTDEEVAAARRWMTEMERREDAHWPVTFLWEERLARYALAVMAAHDEKTQGDP
jgi:hypothetical protein